MDIKVRILVIMALTVLIMYLIKKLVEAVINLWVIIKAGRNPNHEANAESSEVVFNRKTKKLENCGRIIKLPF